MDFIPHSPEDIKKMMEFLGIRSLDELFDDIPDKYKIKKLNLPEGKDEREVWLEFLQIARLNRATVKSFAGAGVYFHYVPAVCDWVSTLSGFLTSYTPYQPEMSQGVLQMLYRFQSLLTLLFDMPVANAGMYGGASALAEACLMAYRLNRKKILISAGTNPLWYEVVKTYLESADVPYDILPLKAGGETEVPETDENVVVQYPNFLGFLEDVERIREKVKGLLIVAVPDPTDLAVLPPPSVADIVVGEGQPLGNWPAFGGSGLGLMLTKEKFIRSMPGRIIGKTVDAEGRDAYCMVLQTREQHIRRHKATSNICTSTVLLAIRSAVYLMYYGDEGLEKVALKGKQNLEKFLRETGATPLVKKFFKEVAVELEFDESSISADFIPPVKLRSIVADKDFSDAMGNFPKNTYIVCTTELVEEEDIKKFASAVRR